MEMIHENSMINKILWQIFRKPSKVHFILWLASCTINISAARKLAWTHKFFISKKCAFLLIMLHVLFSNPVSCGKSWGKRRARNFYITNGERSKIKSMLWHFTVCNKSTSRHFWNFRTQSRDAKAISVFLGGKSCISPKKQNSSIFHFEFIHFVFIGKWNHFRCKLDDVWWLNFCDPRSFTTFNKKVDFFFEIENMRKNVNFWTARGKMQWWWKDRASKTFGYSQNLFGRHLEKWRQNLCPVLTV